MPITVNTFVIVDVGNARKAILWAHKGDGDGEYADKAAFDAAITTPQLLVSGSGTLASVEVPSANLSTYDDIYELAASDVSVSASGVVSAHTEPATLTVKGRKNTLRETIRLGLQEIPGVGKPTPNSTWTRFQMLPRIIAGAADVDANVSDDTRYAAILSTARAIGFDALAKQVFQSAGENAISTPAGSWMDNTAATTEFYRVTKDSTGNVTTATSSTPMASYTPMAFEAMWIWIGTLD